MVEKRKFKIVRRFSDYFECILDGETVKLRLNDLSAALTEGDSVSLFVRTCFEGSLLDLTVIYEPYTPIEVPDVKRDLKYQQGESFNFVFPPSLQPPKQVFKIPGRLPKYFK